jgi:hypothetical protein
MLSKKQLEEIEMNVMSVGCSDTNARRLLDHGKAMLDRLEAAERVLDFYAQEENWTQLASWGGRIHDDESKAIQDAGQKAREALGHHG